MKFRLQSFVSGAGGGALFGWGGWGGALPPPPPRVLPADPRRDGPQPDVLVQPCVDMMTVPVYY